MLAVRDWVWYTPESFEDAPGVAWVVHAPEKWRPMFQALRFLGIAEDNMRYTWRLFWKKRRKHIKRGLHLWPVHSIAETDRVVRHVGGL